VSSYFKDFVYDPILKPIIESTTKNIILIMFLGGVFFIIIGALFGDDIDALSLIPHGSGLAILKIGGAILGAGVFAVIMKSAQFTKVFQKHVFEVFYTPENIADAEELKVKWGKLTSAMLKNSLPISHQDATHGIMDQFFNSELQYHFEGLKLTLDFELQDDNKTLEITSTSETNVVVSPNHEKPVFEQKMLIQDGECHLTSLTIDDTPQDIAAQFSYVDEDPKLGTFSLPLSEIASRVNANGDRIVRLERTYVISQDITKEPYMLATFDRYVKGFTIKAKTNKGSLYFKKTGVGSIEPIEERVDGCGYSRWVLAEENNLLLPGQGYILIFTI